MARLAAIGFAFAAGQEVPGSFSHQLLLPMLQPWLEKTEIRFDESCLLSEIADDALLESITRIADFMDEKKGLDPLLAMRASLRRLSSSMKKLSAGAALCVDKDSDSESLGNKAVQGFQAAVENLIEILGAGRLNDGICPFKQQRQTLIGGAEVGKQLQRLASASTNLVAKSPKDVEVVKKLGKVIGKIFRKVQKNGADPDPPGTIPVNWEMRSAMFGRGMDEL
eukprot:TRINITY_DN5997_c1_g1_i2.p1 TRINITY_DN5997_c1_g1~~TRINITY_DN5997_c1_g1_i2.p1  ORF type:complete len:247 (+),score=57.62 TRINITY_DN5997_c1_g1_i2:72-743(+)